MASVVRGSGLALDADGLALDADGLTEGGLDAASPFDADVDDLGWRRLDVATGSAFGDDLGLLRVKAWRDGGRPFSPAFPIYEEEPNGSRPRCAGLPWVPLGSPSGVVYNRARKRVLCPADMVPMRGGYCIDRYEAFVVELLPGGRTRPHSPYESVTGVRVKALNARGKVPQAHISRNEAEQACFAAGKRLCTEDEWQSACHGSREFTWPYGNERVVGRCNDNGFSGFNHLYGKDGLPPPRSEYTFDNMNDSRLNQLKGTLARSGQFARCKTPDGVFDMVGNLHEWTASQEGTFRGGYYLDVEQLGLGCNYRTTGHNAIYHDYSTGFRCCKTPGEAARPLAPLPPRPPPPAPKTQGAASSPPPEAKPPAAKAPKEPGSKAGSSKTRASEPPPKKAGDTKDGRNSASKGDASKGGVRVDPVKVDPVKPVGKGR